MRILFVLASPEYLRFYDAVLRELVARGHDVSVAVNHVKEQKQARVEDLEGVHALGLLPARKDRWARLATNLRGTVDFLRYLHPDYADAPALRDRMKRKVLERFNWEQTVDATERLYQRVLAKRQRPA